MLSSSLESKEDKSPQALPLHHPLCFSVSLSCLSVCLSLSLSHTHTHTQIWGPSKRKLPSYSFKGLFFFFSSLKETKTKNTSCQVVQPNPLSPPEGSLHSAKPLELTVSLGNWERGDMGTRE